MLTPTKKEVYLVVNSNSPSDFVDELSKSRKDIVYINMEDYTSVKCPECKTSKMAKRTGKFDSFYSCTNYPMCGFKVSTIPLLRSIFAYKILIPPVLASL